MSERSKAARARCPEDKVFWYDDTTVVHTRITITDRTDIEQCAQGPDQIEFHLGHRAQHCTLLFAYDALQEFTELAQQALTEAEQLRNRPARPPIVPPLLPKREQAAG